MKAKELEKELKKSSDLNDDTLDIKETTEETGNEVVEENEEEIKNAEDANAEEINDIEEVENTENKKKDGKATLKKEKKEKKKDKKDLEIEDLKDRLMRQMAEFDNFRKRSEKEKSQMFEIGAKDIIEKILPVIDNFERGISVLTEEEKEGAFAQGIEKIYKQLIDSLSDAGVTTIEAVGNEFDPNLHNAVMHDEDEEQGENLVVEEFQKGYMYKESVVRHSMVKVVN